MYSSQRGAAAMLAIIVIAFLTIIGSGFTFLSSTDVRTAASYRDGVMAQYLAEAGAKRAVSEMRKSASGEWAGETREFDIGRYRVEPVITRGVDREIIVTGIVNNAARKLKLTVSSDSPYNYVAYSGEKMNLAGIIIKGNVGSNADVHISGGLILDQQNGAYSQIDAVGNIYTDSVYAPHKNEHAAPKALLVFDSALRQKFQDAGNIPTIVKHNSGLVKWSTWSSPGWLANKVYYINPEPDYPFYIRSDIEGPGVIYSTQAITIDDGARLTNNIIIISEKSINIGLSKINNCILAAGRDISNSDSAVFRGTAVANGSISITLDMKGQSTLEEQNKTLLNPFLPTAWNSGSVKIKSWVSLE